MRRATKHAEPEVGWPHALDAIGIYGRLFAIVAAIIGGFAGKPKGGSSWIYLVVVMIFGFLLLITFVIRSRPPRSLSDDLESVPEGSRLPLWDRDLDA